jgi:DNA primase|tara:strand:+ start:775 stop:2520 length:1746 start_codon:yes stop_codon:yes gene_type:complete
MKYPKSYIEEIRNRLKVSDVVRLKVNLKKRGKEFVGLSPFKNEKTPSFTVNDEKGFYHCFSTGEHGNIFDFAMKLENINFGEAVKLLAQRAGMQPYRFTKEDEKIEKETQRVQRLFHLFFDECKKKLNNDFKQTHLKYLLDRSLTNNTINFFNLGFCENSKLIQDKLLKDGFTSEELVNSGLFYKKDVTNELINRFKNRIIFPIQNYYNNFIGCGGRAVLDNALAKYINSPETNYFKKSFNLFNLNHARKESSNTNTLILVEGYMDVVSLYNKGIKNVAASLGTAITTAQINLAWKNFDKIIICFDGDQSGIDASYRAAERVLKVIQPGKDIYFAKIPKEQDPDDFVNQFGKDNFLSLLNQSKDLSEVIFNHYSKNTNHSKPSEIAFLEKKLFEIADQIEDTLSKKYIKNSFKNKIFERLIRKKKNQTHNPDEIKKASLRLMLSKEEILELSFLNLVLNYPKFSESKIEDLSSLELNFKDNKVFLSELISSLLNENIKSREDIKKKLSINFNNIINKIETYGNNKEITLNLDEEAYQNIFDDYLNEFNLINKNKEIALIESELAKNPSEKMYDKYISLKNS